MGGRDPRATRLRGRAPGGQPRDGGPGHEARWAGRGDAEDRHPRGVRRAPRPRSRVRPQLDGGVRGGRRGRAGGHRRRAPRRDRLPRDAGRGTGQRQADHDRRRAVRGPRCCTAVSPVRPESRRKLPARFGGRHGRLPRAAGARLVGSVEGQERARRDDRPVLVRRPVAPAAPSDGASPRDHHRGRHGREHHPGPHCRVVHAPRRRPGVLRGDEGAVHPDGRGCGPGHRHDRGRHLLGRRDDDAQQRPARGAVPGQHGRVRRRGHG